MRWHHLHGPVRPGRLHTTCPLSFVLTLVSSMLWRLHHKHKHKAASDTSTCHAPLHAFGASNELLKLCVRYLSVQGSHSAVKLLLQGVTLKLSSTPSCLSPHSSHGS